MIECLQESVLYHGTLSATHKLMFAGTRMKNYPRVQDSFRAEAAKPIHWLIVNMLASVLQIMLGKKHFHLLEGKRAQELCVRLPSKRQVYTQLVDNLKI